MRKSAAAVFRLSFFPPPRSSMSFFANRLETRVPVQLALSTRKIFPLFLESPPGASYCCYCCCCPLRLQPASDQAHPSMHARVYNVLFRAYEFSICWSVLMQLELGKFEGFCLIGQGFFLYTCVWQIFGQGVVWWWDRRWEESAVSVLVR